VSSDNRDHRDELRSLADSLAESVLRASDEEIIEEVQAAGKVPDDEADRLRGILIRAVSAHKRRALRDARDEYEQRLATFEAESEDLPESAEGRRQLLVGILGARPQLRAALTVQFRDSEGLKPEDLTDQEVESYLRQLQSLGVIDETDQGPGNK
jgi:hypothetical protein